MFEHPQYVQSAVRVFYPSVRNLVAQEASIYAQVRNWYFPAKLGASEDVDGGAPALLFQSHHGHSQLVVSESSVSLNVLYSPDWQERVEALREYLVERTALLFEVVSIVSQDDPSFCGSVTRVRVPSSASDDDVVSFVARTFAAGQPDETYHDANVKTTIVVDDLFFSNVTVQNYRTWSVALHALNVLRLSRYRAAERGVEIIVDFNSRYAFNEDKQFRVSRESAIQLINRNLAVVDQTLARIVGGEG